MRVGAAFTADVESKVQASPDGVTVTTSGGLNGSSGFHAAAEVNRPGLAGAHPVPWWYSSPVKVSLPLFAAWLRMFCADGCR